jgi:invasion protein IalB
LLVKTGVGRYLRPSKSKGSGFVRLTLSGFGLLAAVALASNGLGDAAQAQDQAPADQTFGPRAGAQATPDNGPKTESMGTFGAWEVQCATPPAGQDGQAPVKSCGMIQTVQHDKNKNVGLSVIVSKLKKDAETVVLMRVMAPIGVYLPTGIPVEIDGAALPNRLQFTRCMPRLCEGLGEASPESLKKFMKGGAATFYIYDRPGNGYPLKFSLEGFAKALTELDKY